ncbi:hypothetical protein EST38_g12901 [Candolleomyces aberdarensis]|uniref:F-box domain-containing protein n=1 Tax=Candolleomyces aberdarensis TaxID=2316362 RepID=A0A4Q2D1A7_9AGAR|nr:hypothetical protein EST38_g12901 [Candolleomyces aberdarensis]
MPVTSESFEGLPLDVLSLILKHVKKEDFKSLPVLRLVSKAMNALTEPMAFGTVSIKFTGDRMHCVRDQLSALASGQGPNARWTKRLHIAHLVPLKLDQHDGYEPEHYQYLFECQNELLVKSIQSLEGVTWASFDAYDRDEKGPYLDVISSLAQLPKLESLSLLFSSHFDEVESLGLDSFSNLRRLRLIRQPFTKPVMNEVRSMIVQSPDLEELTIETYTWQSVSGGGTTKETPPDMESLFEDAIHKPNFAPRLLKFTIGNNSTLSSKSVPYFRSLTHLNIGPHYGKVEDTFWNALSHAEVVLHSLKLAVFTSAMIQYLTSYVGLNDLNINCRYHDKETLARQVFSSVLPHHRSTLQCLSFVEFTSSVWGITEEHLECVTRCKALRTVALVCLPTECGNDLSIDMVRTLFSRYASSD